MSAHFSIGNPEFNCTSELKKYCGDGRKLIRPLANELRLASEELQAALKEVPGGRPGMFGADNRVKARLVAAHLRHAAEGIEHSCAGLVRTYLSFERHFLHNTPERSKRSFNLNQ